MNLSKLTISSRLIILISALVAMLLTIGGIGLFGTSQTDDALKRVYEDRLTPLGQVAEIQRLLMRNRLAIANTLLDPIPEVIAQNTAEIDANLPAIDKIWDAFMATHLTADEALIAKQLSQDRALFVQEGVRPAVAALRANDTAQVHQLLKEKVGPLHDTLGFGIEALMKLQLAVAKQELDAATKMYNNIRLLSISAILISVLLTVWFGTALVRSISRAMMARFHLQGNLAKVVSDLRTGSEGLAAASAQIASGNHDLSSRTEQQASALQETAASIKHVNDSSKRIFDITIQGRGFAVVASEVRNLAGRPAAAAKEMKNLISTSAERVDKGTAVVDRAGITMDEVVTSIRRATDRMDDISAASREQSQGVSQVGQAVAQMDQVMRQNAAM